MVVAAVDATVLDDGTDDAAGVVATVDTSLSLAQAATAKAVNTAINFRATFPPMTPAVDVSTVTATAHPGRLVEEDEMPQNYHLGQRELQDRFDTRRLADLAKAVFANCRRYVHHFELVERSPFVPVADVEPPVPHWKRDLWFDGTLAHDDPALDPSQPSAQALPQF